MSKKLHIFDLDGTLLMGSTASIEVSKQLGTLEKINELESDFKKGNICTKSFAKSLRKEWGGLTNEMINNAYNHSSWLSNMESVFSNIKKNGGKSILITMSPNFFADLLKDKGIDEIYASQFPEIPLSEEIDVRKILSPTDKISITYNKIQQLGLSTDDCVAYGDSSSDIPLFGALSKTVAINASDELRKIASTSYSGSDLYEAYFLAEHI